MNSENFFRRSACPGCGSTSHREVYCCAYSDPPIADFLDRFYAPNGPRVRQHVARAEYVLDECCDCGMIYQRHVPNEALTKRVYEEFIDTGRAFEHYMLNTNQERCARFCEEVMLAKACLAGNAKRLKVLDFGMGWGQYCQIAKAFGCEVYGTELSEACIAHAAASGIGIVTWDQIPTHRFDLINTEQVFEHLAHPLATLRHLKDALRPGGVVRISVPDGCGIKRRLRKGDWSAPKGSRESLNPVSPLEHVNCFTRASLIKMADKAGLRQIRIPLKKQYAYGLNWRSLRSGLKSLARPIYRDVLRKGTCLFLGDGSREAAA